jgi:N-acetyl-anhydromuramyl-L-alanine amidase AmpD
MAENERPTDPSNLNPWDHIYERLTTIEDEVDRANETAKNALNCAEETLVCVQEIKGLIEEIKQYANEAASSAHASADSAQKSLSLSEALGDRFETLRREHVHNHPTVDSLVPPSLNRRQRKTE